MHISSAQFIKGITSPDANLDDGIPQVAFIGRSNVGKSSVINVLANQKDLAKTSSFPGRTQQINLFLINKSFYLVDLPGYGYAQLSGDKRREIENLINWYFFDSNYVQKKIVLIIDAKIGPTKDDMEMLYSLEKFEKNIVVVANKVDAIKKPDYDKQLEKIQNTIGIHKVIPFSAKERFGVNALAAEIA